MFIKETLCTHEEVLLRKRNQTVEKRETESAILKTKK